MATVATTLYSPFSPNANQGQPGQEEQYISTFFCRALYDYQAKDASSLSFHKNDIIEVLTQLESGWWDGLLGDERGWFPSNYVLPISDEEAESVLSGSEFSVIHPPTSNESLVDMSLALSSQLERDREWLAAETENSGTPNGTNEPAVSSAGGAIQSSDFWMPQVTSDAQNYYYVNTQTGQQSRDIPQDADGEVSDSDLAALTQSSSRAGSSAGLGLGATEDGSTQAGFGVPRHSGTPEPWVRRLADDGRTYYYQNKLDGQVQLTLPTSNQSKANGQQRSHARETPTARPEPSTSQARTQRPPDHLSIYSDDSDIEPSDIDQAASFSTSQSSLHDPSELRQASSIKSAPNEKRPAIQLTPAERLAQSLQQAVAPPPPELVTELSDTARKAISMVVTRVQRIGIPRTADGDGGMEDLINAVVVSVRDLLYISAPPSGNIPNDVLPAHARDPPVNNASQAMLKHALRKVTATLSKLVLSARAIQFESGTSTSDAPLRIEADAEELERAIVAFVLEVQRTQNRCPIEQVGPNNLKRLRGVFLTSNIGLGLVGAGAAGSWKGFGWVALDESDERPGRILGTEVLSELETHMTMAEERSTAFVQALESNSAERVCTDGRTVLTHLFSLLTFVANIHVARHVDVDGIKQESGASNELYTQSVEKGRSLVRELEAAVQSLYDDGSAMLMAVQSIQHLGLGQSKSDRDVMYQRLSSLSATLKTNLRVVQQSLEALLSIGHHQADMSQGDYNGSIEWRMSRLSMIDNRLRPLSTIMDESYDPEGDVVDMEVAFTKPSKTQLHDHHKWDSTVTLPESQHIRNRGDSNASVAPTWGTRESQTPTMATDAAPETPTSGPGDATSPFLDDESLSEDALKRRGEAAAKKLEKVLGDLPTHYVNTVTADAKPWYLRPSYDPSEIIIDPDGGVKGGTVPALVERLTAHEHGDPTFIKTFLMTFKSFTTVDELFNLLVARFNIQPPPNLNPDELQDWTKLKQHVIQTRVLNTFKSMIVDEDVLEKEDTYILDRMKEFISQEEVSKLAAAKQLMILIERSKKGGDPKVLINTSQERPPPPILPKNSKKVKLLDIDPLELARQLTLMESSLYQKIRPMECLARSRKQSGEHNDNIATIIQLCNRIALWVTDSILEKEDSRKRAAVLKQFIGVADRCRTLHNYSSMVAIISGLNNPPIRRLKRTWEQVNQKFMSLLGACEMTIDTGKNFANYRTTLAKVAPPCVPFIGVFLTTLTFIQDGAEDNLSANVVNFRKRQKASEVIRDIKRWQSPPYNFQPVPSIQTYLDDVFKQFTSSVELGDYFWNLSLQREPREREDEKMARLLQESGFL